MLERVIANDRTLQMLSKVHARIMADVETEGLYWMDRESITTCEIIPFVSAELQSYGWTLMLSATGADILDVHRLARPMGAQRALPVRNICVILQCLKNIRPKCYETI